MRKEITFSNCFHGTETKALLRPEEDGTYYVPPLHSRRITKKLCGMTDCNCRTLSIAWEMKPEDDRMLEIQELQDGGMFLYLEIPDEEVDL